MNILGAVIDIRDILFQIHGAVGRWNQSGVLWQNIQQQVHVFTQLYKVMEGELQQVGIDDSQAARIRNALKPAQDDIKALHTTVLYRDSSSLTFKFGVAIGSTQSTTTELLQSID
jgi:hypothetical protein